MKIFFLISFLTFTFAKQSLVMGQQKYSYLALGDSYTIGESVPGSQNFPNQVVSILKKENFDFENPEIVAKTGWTTDELQNEINKHTFHPPYDFVTLLIGVNNQYRGRTVEDYEPEFESLLQQAIQFAGNKSDNVIVLSIPDWGVTPFAKDRNKEQIAKEIDAYNEANKMIADKYKVHYINITPDTRKAASDADLVAGDGLHPSGKEYTIWADAVVSVMKKELQ